MTQLRALPLICALAAVLRPAQGWAQAVDYGALEQIFGEPITTSVTGKPQRASEVPGDLTIITQDDIRRSGATNVPDILQFVTGIDVRRYSFGDSQVGVNGYDSPINPRLLVMVDGRQVYKDDYGFVAWNGLPVQLSEIRQIEVVRGPNSALFGFNAASGVVNIITYDPLSDDVNTATIRGGTQAFGQAEAVGTAHIGTTVGVRLSAGGFTANDFTTQAANAGIAAPRQGNVNLDGRWQISPNLLLRVSAGAGSNATARPIVGGLYASDSNEPDYGRLGLAADTRAGAFDVDVYRNGETTAARGYTFTNDVVVAKASDLVKLNAANTVRVGLEYRSNVARGNLFGGSTGYDDTAASGLWEWQIAPDLTLTNAVRVDHLALHYAGTRTPAAGLSLAAYDHAAFTEPSFNSGLVIKVTGTDTVRLTTARGLQVPSLLDYGLQVTIGPLNLLGSPTVAPVAVWETKLGYEHLFAALGASTTMDMFFQRNTNLIGTAATTALTSSSGQLFSDTMTIGSSNEIGLDLGVRGSTDGGFRWNASYRFAAISDDISRALAPLPDPQTRYASGTPRHTVILGAGYARGRWELDAALHWQSAYTDYTQALTSSSAAVDTGDLALNARVGWNVTDRLTIAGVAQQFNVSRLLIPAGSTLERRATASATLRF